MTSPTFASDARQRSSSVPRLHPDLQRWVFDQGWTTLHDAQEKPSDQSLTATVTSLSLRPPPRAELPTAAAISATVAPAEPQLTAVRPRTKPAAVVATVAAPAAGEIAKPKPARLAHAAEPKSQADVYQPPSRTEAAYDPTAEAAGATPVQVPGDIPAEHVMAPVADKPAASSEAAGPATSGPAPLVPMPQP